MSDPLYNQPVTYVPDPTKADGTDGTTGGGGGNADVVYINDPNVENLKPADPTKSCTAYSASGSGSFFGWSISLQRWV